MALVVDQWPRGIPMTLAGKGFRTWAFIWPLTLGTPTDSKKSIWIQGIGKLSSRCKLDAPQLSTKQERSSGLLVLKNMKIYPRVNKTKMLKLRPLVAIQHVSSERRCRTRYRTVISGWPRSSLRWNWTPFQSSMGPVLWIRTCLEASRVDKGG